MKQKKRVLWVCAVIGFIFTLFMVEASPIGSAAVADHNGGYGTFDMKSYDEAKVKEVLADMDADGISTYQKYYVADFLFIIFFGMVQCMLSASVYKEKSMLRKIAIGVPVARGIFDIIENILLLITISNYPQINKQMITVSTISTQCKLWSIRIWVAMILIGIVYNFYRKMRKA